MVPVRSLDTKKIAPPPSRALLPSIGVGQAQGEVVAVEIDRAAAAAARSARPRRVGAGADGLVPRKTLSRIFQETPMLLSAEPLEQRPRVNVLPMT